MVVADLLEHDLVGPGDVGAGPNGHADHCALEVGQVAGVVVVAVDDQPDRVVVGWL